MDADWEIEIGGGAPVIEALWPGFVDLRRNPERIAEIAEAVAFPALASLLQSLNDATSPVWTAKCDLWEPVAEDGSQSHPSLACYVDLLPLEGKVFAEWQQAERFCREWIARLDSISPLSESQQIAAHLACCPDSEPELRLDLIVRQAIAGDVEGFGVTAYLSAVSQIEGSGGAQFGIGQALASAMTAFAAAIPLSAFPETAAAKLQ